MRGIAFRRHQLAKKKRLCRKIYPHDVNAKWANHLHGCSCYMCGNPRKWWKQKTFQEMKADEAFEMERGQDGNAADC